MYKYLKQRGVMSKELNTIEQNQRKYLREFVNDVINKDYAKANANLTAVVNEKIKAKVVKVLEENP